MEPKQQNKPLKIARVGVVIVMILGSTLMYLLWIGGRLGPTPPRILFKLPSEYQGVVIVVEGQPNGNEFSRNHEGEIIFDVPPDGLIVVREELTSYNPRFVVVGQNREEITIAEDTEECKGKAVQNEQKNLVACFKAEAIIHNRHICPFQIGWIICTNATCQRFHEDYEKTISEICDGRFVPGNRPNIKSP
jgi:hypothetical protein